jgi:hypothetical protein
MSALFRTTESKLSPCRFDLSFLLLGRVDERLKDLSVVHP